MLNFFKILLAFATAALIVGTGVVAGLFWHFSHGLPDHKQLADYQPATVSRLYAADGRLLMEYAKEKRVFVAVADTIRSFKAIVAGEYDHLPEAAFYMVGAIEEAVAKGQKMAAETSKAA